MAMTNAEKQKAFRRRQREQGKYPFTIYMTEREKYYIERVLKSMRETGGTPAMIRNKKGQMVHLDV
jgi:ribosomal protein L25 (general stress protein Ctc)